MPHPLAHRAATDLRTIREWWGDLLAAIERPPAADWPPRETRGFLDQLAARATADAEPDEETPAEPTIGRMPLVLREHPAPLNLEALDAAMSVERELFDLADQIAEQVQRPIRTIPLPTLDPGRTLPDPDDAANPARWHLPTHSASVTGRAASPGSRAYGLHWAAVWIEGRVLNEDTVAPRPSNTVHVPLFRPLPEHLLREAANVSQRARQRVEKALGRDPRHTPLDRPCPWCGGQLVGHAEPGSPDTAYVTCETGAACTAPVPLDRGCRVWRGPDRVGLRLVLNAAGKRAAA